MSLPEQSAGSEGLEAVDVPGKYFTKNPENILNISHLVSWASRASLAQSVSVWTSLSSLATIFLRARKVSSARPERERRNTRAATSLSVQHQASQGGLRD